MNGNFHLICCYFGYLFLSRVLKHFLIPFNYLNLHRISVPLHSNHRYFLSHLCRLRATSYIHSPAGQNSKLQPFSWKALPLSILQNCARDLSWIWLWSLLGAKDLIRLYFALLSSKRSSNNIIQPRQRSSSLQWISTCSRITHPNVFIIVFRTRGNLFVCCLIFILFLFLILWLFIKSSLKDKDLCIFRIRREHLAYFCVKKTWK